MSIDLFLLILYISIDVQYDDTSEPRSEVWRHILYTVVEYIPALVADFELPLLSILNL